MFVVSKLLSFLTQPLTWVATLLVLAAILHKRKPSTGGRLLWLALALLLGMGYFPLPTWIAKQLESRYVEFAPQADLRKFAGFIVLGGATESGPLSQAHRQPLLNEAAERMTAAIAIQQRNPELRMIFTGGEGALLGTGPSEADRARVFFDAMGLDSTRIQYESASRNTHENAVLSAQLPNVDPTQPWLLVTSAWHMPRSMATFTKAGWNVTAYPVDFRSGGAVDWLDYDLVAGARRWELVLHELLGIVAYRITGRL